ncbi:MAG: thiamine pyrophosphate-binding protein [Thermodesulfobacteriota bacterium]
MMKVYEAIAQFLISKEVPRIFGLCGGHIQPLWDEIARRGLKLVDVRDEKAAVHMAQAQAELTGKPGVALVTAGPGMTNAVTGIANAFVSRVPVVVLTGSTPRPQRGKGALQEIEQVEIVRAVTRAAQRIDAPESAVKALADAFAIAEGCLNEPGPAFVDFPTDVLRSSIPQADIDLAGFQSRPHSFGTVGTKSARKAADLIWSAKRPVVITGRGAKSAGREIVKMLDRVGCVYLDTAESKGLVPAGHPAFVPSMRARAMTEADLVITIGRSLDYQLAYGSRAVFKNAGFVRIGAFEAEVQKNRRGEAEISGPIRETMGAILKAADDRRPSVDSGWITALRREDRKRRSALENKLQTAPPGRDGGMHPYRLLGAVKKALAPDAVVVADGGDILSFARQVFSEWTYLDSGPFGCLGVGAPYGISAALTFPERQVVVVTGDGAFGFNAMELDTCRRHGARVVFVVANNAAWNIERHDQLLNYQGRLVGVDLEKCDYAALAGSLGVQGVRVTDPEGLPDALKNAFELAPSLLDVSVTRDAPSPDFLSGIAGVPDLQALTKWDEMEAGLSGEKG